MVLFIKRVGWRSVALLLLALAAFTVTALGSYNPYDPAPNHDTVDPPTNLMGYPGAALADILMQTIGLAGFVLVLPLLGWTWQLIRLKGMPWFWLNLAATPFALISIAVFLTFFEPGPDFITRTGFGGSLGDAIFGMLSGGLGSVIPADMTVYSDGVIALLAFCIGFYLLIVSVALTSDERATIRAYIWQALCWAVGMIRDMTSRLLWMLANLSKQKTKALPADDGDDDTYDSEPRPSLKRKTPSLSITPAVSESEASSRVTKRPKTTKGARESKEKQIKLNLGEGDFQLPPLELLSPPPPSDQIERLSAEALEANARMLEGVLDDFGVKGEIVEVRPGPVVTLYELEPAPGLKSSRVIGLADDIARSMSAISARVAVVPGKNAIGIELPNTNREVVFLRELLASRNYERSKANLPLALGKDIGGAPMVADLAAMPHLLVAGTTGAGKSVGLNTFIMSILYRLSPDQVRMIMIDPKQLELSIYDDIPHLLTPVVTNPKKAVVSLKWAVREMEERYEKMSRLGVRNLAAFNERVKKAAEVGEVLSRTVQTGFDKETGQPTYEEQTFDFKPLPYIVIIIDEMADLMLVAGKDVEATVQRLAQMARAAGLHLIMATQRPSVDVITGTIKANFPTRISFQVTSKIDSRTILGEQGAEQLLGRGDMLYMAGGGRTTRVHGAFVSDDEVEDIVSYLKKQGLPDYIASVTEEPEEGFDSPFIPGPDGKMGGPSESDSLYDQAVDIVLRDRRPTTSYIQRRLKIGYNKAATLIEEMEENGVISAPNHKGQREVLVPEREEF